MDHLRKFCLAAMATLLACTAVLGQEEAALRKLRKRYTAEGLEDIRQQAHYRYAAMVLFEYRSFEVIEHGRTRAATEDEVAHLDLAQYDRARREDESAIVHDDDLGLDLRLMGRKEFQGLVMAQLDDADRAAYLENLRIAAPPQERMRP